MLQFTLYARSYCHLCDDMLVALHALTLPVPYGVEVLDVDQDPALIAKYDELVPVLTVRDAAGAERTLCHYFLDPDPIEALVNA